MAKSGKNPSQRQSKSAKTPVKAAAPVPKPAAKEVKELTPVAHQYTSEALSHPLLPKIFWGLAIAGFIFLVVLSLGSGINADDKFQVDYSNKLVNYYATFGSDTAALNVPDGNMHLYGGFFEVVTGFVNKIAGFQPTDLAYHQVRHASSAILGWVAILCAALLARLIGGWHAGIVTFLLMLASPRFIGDALMNPKDIPFAAGYMMAIYNLAAVLDRLPRPNRWHLAGLAGGLGIALALRAGGLLAFAIVLLFAGLHLLRRQGGLSALGNTAAIRKYALYVGGAAIAGYIGALLFWPYALQAPLSNPFTALSKFADLEVKIRVLYEGTNVMSDKTPWHYPVKWILYTIPMAVIAGLLGVIVTLPALIKRYDYLWIALVLFAGIFPVFYIVYKDSVIHDGWRHLTFSYPPLVIAAGLFWADLARRFATRKAVQYAVYGVAFLLSADAFAFTLTNPKFPYVYFNPLTGGIKGAYGQFETDYWGVSIRQGLEWLEKEGVIRHDLQEPVVIATNMFYSAKQLTAKYGDKVKIKYLKWERRCDDAWDYALYPTRFIDGNTLQKGMWPPDNAIHIVQANGVPLLAVLKDTGKNCSLGVASAKVGDFASAIKYFEQEVANVPDNEVAWANLSQAYLNNNQLEEAKQAAEKTLSISPDDTQASNVLGMYWLYKNDGGRAKNEFELALKREPNNPAAWYYLALIANQQGDAQTALNNAMKAIELAPNFKPAYELSAQIYEANGQADAARRFRAAIGQIK